MILAIYNLLYFGFGKNVWVILPLIILSIVATLVILLFTLLLILDTTFRPSIPQYPYNFILDRMVPITFICSPTILILYLNPANTSWIEKFGYIIFIHISIIIPTMFIWANNRNWSYNNEINQSWKTWNNPLVFFDIAVALIYPAIWGFYFNCLRYIHLGKEINLISFITVDIFTFVIVILFLWPFTSVWFRFILQVMISIRRLFWSTFIKLIMSILSLLLKYKCIFVFFSVLNKISFLWISFIIHHPFLYVTPKSKLKQYLHKLWLNPVILYGVVLSVFLSELIISKGTLYYSLYTLLIFLLLKSFIYFFNTFAADGPFWIRLCCQANYTHLRWKDPYYPEMFWLSFNDLREHFGGYPDIPDELNNHIQVNIINKWRERRELLRSKRLFVYMNISEKHISFYHRFIIVNRHWNGL